MPKSFSLTIHKKKQQQQNISDEIQYFNIYYPQYKVFCDNCGRDITDFTRILCQDCLDKVDICVNCFLNLEQFSVLENKRKHLISHQYSIINKLNFPLFVYDWTAKQELIFIESIQKNGFGNWKDVSEMMDQSKSIEQISQHYDDIYIDEKFKKMKLLTQKKKNKIRILNRKQQKQQLSNENITIQINDEQIIQEQDNQMKGYWPKRDDYLVEYDNNAELLLVDLEFQEDDDLFTIKKKMQIFELFNSRIDQREKLKQFVKSYDLLGLNQDNKKDNFYVIRKFFNKLIQTKPLEFWREIEKFKLDQEKYTYILNIIINNLDPPGSIYRRKRIINNTHQLRQLPQGDKLLELNLQQIDVILSELEKQLSFSNQKYYKKIQELEEQTQLFISKFQNIEQQQFPIYDNKSINLKNNKCKMNKIIKQIKRNQKKCQRTITKKIKQKNMNKIQKKKKIRKNINYINKYSNT